MPAFNYIERGKARTAVFIPGWASDHRIFGSVDIEFNYLLPEKFDPDSFETGLVEMMKKRGLEKVAIIAWSMGCFTACDFLAKHRYASDEVVFIGSRPRYPESGIREIKNLLKRNKAAFLYKFYSDCFSAAEREELKMFKRYLMKEYIKDLDEAVLMNGLDYMMRARIDPAALSGVRLKFIHGAEDSIAPLGEALGLKNDIGQDIEFVLIPEAGHMPFLRPDFKRSFYGDSGVTG